LPKETKATLVGGFFIMVI